MSAPAFQFYPKQWLGDDKVLAMDWDARAMHMHLMCIAWQQEQPCTLPDDDGMIRRWLGNPKQWERIKPQIFSAWKMIGGRWVQSGLLTEFEKQNAYRETRKAGAAARWSKDARALHMECTSDALQSSSSISTPVIKSTPPKAAPSGQIEELYSLYPRHEGKGAAEKAIQKALAKHSFDELKLALGSYCRKVAIERTEQRFIPLPATWFNQGRWADDMTPHPQGTSAPAVIPGPPTKHKTFEEIEAEERDQAEKDYRTWLSMGPAFKAANPWKGAIPLQETAA